MKRERWFIIAPTQMGDDVGDSLHVVCSTSSRGSYMYIYQADRYEERGRHDSLASAKAQCERNGHKNPFVLT